MNSFAGKSIFAEPTCYYRSHHKTQRVSKNSHTPLSNNPYRIALSQCGLMAFSACLFLIQQKSPQNLQFTVFLNFKSETLWGVGHYGGDQVTGRIQYSDAVLTFSNSSAQLKCVYHLVSTGKTICSPISLGIFHRMANFSKHCYNRMLGFEILHDFNSIINNFFVFGLVAQIFYQRFIT